MLGAGILFEQDIGSPMRLVTAADIEDEGVRPDRDGNTSAVERAKPASQLGHSPGSWQMAARQPCWQDCALFLLLPRSMSTAR